MTEAMAVVLVFDVKHDAWVIPQLSHGILLIVDSEENVGTPALNVRIVTDESDTESGESGGTTGN